jgi:hypothetical protein
MSEHDYESMSKVELQDEAASRGLTGLSTENKDGLIAALKADDAENEEPEAETEKEGPEDAAQVYVGKDPRPEGTEIHIDPETGEQSYVTPAEAAAEGEHESEVVVDEREAAAAEAKAAEAESRPV